MEAEYFSMADGVAIAVALLSLWLTLRQSRRQKTNEIFTLRQSVLLKAEQARSAWYALNHENEMLLFRVRNALEIDPKIREIALNFLDAQKEHIKSSILDASALAEDVAKNVNSFSEDKCQKYLQLIEPSIERLRRSTGVSEMRISQILSI